MAHAPFITSHEHQSLTLDKRHPYDLKGAKTVVIDHLKTFFVLS